MSLLDIAIEIIDHPVAKQLAPLAIGAWGDRIRQERLSIQQENLEAQYRILIDHARPERKPTLEVVRPESQRADSDDLYRADRNWDTGCAVCGKAHLAATAGMLDRAAQLAAKSGQCDDDCTYYVAAAQREIVNLNGYDWTPDQIAATEPAERLVLEQWSSAINTFEDQLFVGVEGNARRNLARAAGALEEAGRFARSAGVQHPEAQKRIADAEALLASTERGEWSPERRQTMAPEVRAVIDPYLPAFRRQRQFLLNGMESPDDLDTVAADVGKLNAALQSVAIRQLDPKAVQALAQSAKTIREGFRNDLAAIHAPVRAATQQAIAQAGGNRHAEH